MNILISINSKYIIPAKVMLKSLSSNLKKAFNVYLLYSDLKRKEIERFSKYCEKECNAKLYPMKMDLSEFFGGGELQLTGWFSEEIYFRVIAPFVLPDDIERILWIDADIVVKKEISRLYYSDIAGAALGVVRDMGVPGLVKECCDRLKLKKNSVYFNSGIILYNLPLIRKQWSREQFIQAVYNIQKLNLVYPDQDILNILFESNKMLLADTWNFQIRSWNKVDESVIDNAAVIHYVGEVKPWTLEYGNETKKIWWKYYSLCDLRGYYMLKMKNIYERYKKCFHRIMRK